MTNENWVMAVLLVVIAVLVALLVWRTFQAKAAHARGGQPAVSKLEQYFIFNIFVRQRQAAKVVAPESRPEPEPVSPAAQPVFGAPVVPELEEEILPEPVVRVVPVMDVRVPTMAAVMVEDAVTAGNGIIIGNGAGPACAPSTAPQSALDHAPPLVQFQQHQQEHFHQLSPAADSTHLPAIAPASASIAPVLLTTMADHTPINFAALTASQPAPAQPQLVPAPVRAPASGPVTSLNSTRTQISMPTASPNTIAPGHVTPPPNELLPSITSALQQVDGDTLLQAPKGGAPPLAGRTKPTTQPQQQSNTHGGKEKTKNAPPSVQLRKNEIMKPLKIMLLGNTSSGKTFFLGSLFTLAAHNIGEKGFRVVPKNPAEEGQVQKIYKAVQEGKGVLTTSSLKDAPLILRQGVEDRLEISVTDIIGQSVMPGGQYRDATGKLQEIIPDFDAFIVFLQAPANEEEQLRESESLAQCLAFISSLLAGKTGIPVVLILNKIDLLPNAKGAREKIDETKNNAIKGMKDIKARMDKISNTLGELIGPLVTNIIYNDFNYTLIDQFFRSLRRDNVAIPHKIFPCTSTGFDHVDGERLMPYGTGVAFLWTIYAILKFRQQASGVYPAEDDLVRIIDELLHDIYRLSQSGKAYFDNDADKIWHFRMLSDEFASDAW